MSPSYQTGRLRTRKQGWKLRNLRLQSPLKGFFRRKNAPAEGKPATIIPHAPAAAKSLYAFIFPGG